MHAGVAEESGWQFTVGKKDGERAECRLPAVVYGLIFGAKNVCGMCQRENIIPGPERHSFSLSLSNYFPYMYSGNNTTSLINMGPVKVNSLKSVR